MARLRTRVGRAAALHRQVAAVSAIAGAALDARSSVGPLAELNAEQRHLAARLRAVALQLVPGWLGADLDALTATTPLGGQGAPAHVRVGHAQPLDDARFPIVVPLLGAGHLAVDADARDPRVAGLLRSLVLRLLAGAPAGTLMVRAADTGGTGTTFDLFHDIDDLMPPPVTDRVGLREVLGEAERWVRTPPGDGRILLLVIASLPELTEGSDLARIASLARNGPSARLHLVVAGWPPPPLTAETTQPPLPRCTQITLRNPYAWVGNPPDGSYAATGPLGPGMPGRLNAPAYLDPDPPAELVRRVCDQLAAQLAERSGIGLSDHVRARLEDDPTYLELAARTADRDATPLPVDRAPRVLLGHAIDVSRSTISFPLDTAPGRHVAIIGPDPDGGGILAAAALSLAAQHRPGTARFHLLGEAGTLGAELSAAGQRVGSPEPGAFAGHTYVVCFGMDGPDLRDVLREGPARHAHVLGWWREPGRFLDCVGEGLAHDGPACLVVTDVPAADASLLVGAPVEWEYRPHRALLHDRLSGRTTDFVPFVHTGWSR